MSATLHVAVFVKTPGLSPVKTRLAEGVGEETALAFYWQACGAVAATLSYAAALGDPVVVPYWAVAEAEGLARWPRFAVVAQGEGGLGDRLAQVTEALLGSAGAAVLIGADAPQLDHAVLASTSAALDGGADFVLGPANDGGFYLFATTRPIPRAVWTSVPYSDPTTAARLAAALAPLGTVAWLPQRLTDVDSATDLAVVRRELAALPDPTREQSRLAAWLTRLSSTEP